MTETRPGYVTTPRSIVEGLAGELVAVEFLDPYWFRSAHPTPRPALRVLGKIGQPIDDEGFSVIALDYVEDGDGMGPVQEGQWLYYSLVRSLTILRPKKTICLNVPN